MITERVAFSRPPTDTDPGEAAWRSIQEMIFSTAARDPQKIAVRCGDTAWTFAELERSARALAAVLSSRGVGPGAVVGVCATRSPETVAALVGVLATGAAYTPVDPGWPEDRRNVALRDAGVVLALTDDPDRIPAGMGRIVLEPGPVGQAPAHEPRASAPSDPVYIISTSGSTGRPKGVVIPQRALVNFVSSMMREPGVDADDVVLAATTFAFDMSVFEIYLPLIAGAEMLLVPDPLRRDGPGLAAELERRGVTIAQGTPGLWRMLRAAGWEGSSSLKILTGAEPVPRALVNDLAGRCRELWVMYGPTETTVWSTCGRVEGGEGPVPLGSPIDRTWIHVVDRHGRPAADGEPGEVWIGGDGVALGYQGRPDLTAERFVADPFRPGEIVYRTGDIVRRRGDRLEYVGRVDDQVKVRGYRVEPGEVEARLEQLPGVRQAAVVLRQDGPSARLVGWYVGDGDPGALRSELSRVLPDYLVPSVLVRIDEIPLNDNGKVDRGALAARAIGVERVSDPPRTDAEAVVHALWAEILQRPDVACGENFFEAGGDSLLLATLHARLMQAVGRNLPLTDLFAHPTIRSQALLLQGGSKTAGDAHDRATRRREALASRRKTMRS